MPSKKGPKREQKVEGPLVVGIGASAGGIQALGEFFQHTPEDSGIVYVVILHLSPEHDSQLANVLQHSTKLPVTQVVKETRVEPNHVYVVPPDKSLSMSDGKLVLKPIETVEERRAPVDIFFRTLAESHGPNAVGVVLSGTGANGSMGIKRIKEMGGVTFAQNPREAEFNEMPRNSIATELIDMILPVAEIPAQIVRYRDRIGAVQIAEVPNERSDDQQNALREIFMQLRLRTGHDFSNYKRPTILRRIARRISVRNLPGLPEYADYLRDNPEESAALLKDLLISVTNFFRDKKAFEALEKDILPKLFSGGQPHKPVRIWVPGCATGEEAYSLAMLAAELTGSGIDAPPVQIFATDIDEHAIATAREGVYTLNDTADVSPERLRRFFTKEGENYRIRREIRESILFAHHNLIKDPPFSHLDLVSCRNLLIYLNPAAQERVMETIHFALKPGGYLFIGTSESADGSSELFVPVDKENHIFQSRQVASRPFPVPESVPIYRATVPPPSAAPSKSGDLDRITYNDLHLRLVEEFAPPSVVINQDHDIVHISERAGKYMTVAGGEPTNNLLRLIRQDIRLELRTALFQAAQQRANVEVKGIKVKVNSHEEIVNLLVRPVINDDDPARGFILVIFEPVEGDASGAAPTDYVAPEPVARQLEEELVRSRTQLQSALEQSEVQAEELRASNEELQAMNEELRSSAEELETSKEELQSINEELTTVNQELKVKIEELSHTNNNFTNLLNSIDIGVIFLDRGLRVNLFSPAASSIFNLIGGDIGRPLSDITSKLQYGDLTADADKVLESLQTLEREINSIDGRIFEMRVFPYRTTEDRINGVVLTFVDITERKQSEIALRTSEEKYTALFAASPQPFLILGPDAPRFTITDVNEAYLSATMRTRDQLIGRAMFDAFPDNPTDASADGVTKLRASLERVLQARVPDRMAIQKYDVVRPDGGFEERWWSPINSPVIDENGHVALIIHNVNDVTEELRAEETKRAHEERLRNVLDSMAEGFALFGSDFTILDVNDETLKLDGRRRKELVGRSHWEAFPGSEHSELGKLYKRCMRDRTTGVLEHLYEWPDGKKMWAEVRVYPNPDGRLACFWRDITDRKAAEEASRESEERLNLAIEAAQMGTWDWDIRTGKVVWNREHFEMQGYDPAEIIPSYQAWLKRVHPDDRERAEAALATARDRKEPFVHEFRSLHPDGTIRWLSARGLFLYDGDEPIRMIGVVRDTTESRTAEDEVRQSRERMSFIASSVYDYAILSLDVDRKITTWNVGAEKIFGWTEQEVLGKSGDMIFTDEDRKKKAPEQEMKTAIEHGRAPDERFHTRKDGSTFYASGVMSLVRNGNGAVVGFAKILRDMTHVQAAEKALRERQLLQRLMTAQEDERARLARDLHDALGQELTLLRLRLDSSAKSIKDHEVVGKLHEMEQIAERVDRGIDRIAWELRPLALADLGLIPALEKYVKDWSEHTGLEATLVKTSLRRTRFRPEVETSLYRIVQEALNNVAKHAKASRADIVVERRKDRIILVVEDDGRGFSTRGKRATSGLGLTGMRERAELIGGSFEIESSRGKGTAVYVSVPADLATGSDGHKKVTR